jgi:hypothetical protein
MSNIKFYGCNKMGHMKRDCKNGETLGSEVNLTRRRCLKAVDSAPLNERESRWIVDSGASNHMSHRKEWFTNFEETGDIPIWVANNQIVHAKGKGAITVRNKTEKGIIDMKFEGVLYVPELYTNLLSVGKIAKRGAKVEFSKEICKITKHKEELATAKFDGIVWVLQGNTKFESAMNVMESSYMLIHRRLGHLGKDTIRKLMESNSALGSEGIKIPDIIFEDCIGGKMVSRSFEKKSITVLTEPLELIYSDVC